MCNSVLRYNWFETNLASFMGKYPLPAYYDGEDLLAFIRQYKGEYILSKDISRKVRSAHNTRGRAGEPLSQPPYGYVKDSQDKKCWIIDPEAASVVREIFKLYLDGNGEDTIARIMQEEQHLNCTAYWASKGINRGGMVNRRTAAAAYGIANLKIQIRALPYLECVRSIIVPIRTSENPSKTRDSSKIIPTAPTEIPTTFV